MIWICQAKSSDGACLFPFGFRYAIPRKPCKLLTKSREWSIHIEIKYYKICGTVELFWTDAGFVNFWHILCRWMHRSFVTDSFRIRSLSNYRNCNFNVKILLCLLDLLISFTCSIWVSRCAKKYANRIL